MGATKEHIQAGDIFQLVLSQRFERRTFATPFEIYRALRVVNPSPYMVYMQVRDSVGGGWGGMCVCVHARVCVCANPLALTATLINTTTAPHHHHIHRYPRHRRACTVTLSTPASQSAPTPLSSSLYCIGFGLVWAGIYNPPPTHLLPHAQARGCHIVSSSPEILCRVDNSRVVTNRPLAGTRARGKDPQADKALEVRRVRGGR